MYNQQQDIQAIGELFTALSEAWNNGDGAAYGECFTEDADYVTFNGQHLKGRQQIADVHQWLFDGPLKGSKLTSGLPSQPNPRFIDPQVAILHGIGEAQLADPSQDAAIRASINTNVVVKQDGIWKITAFHNCRIQEMPQGRK